MRGRAGACVGGLSERVSAAGAEAVSWLLGETLGFVWAVCALFAGLLPGGPAWVRRWEGEAEDRWWWRAYGLGASRAERRSHAKDKIGLRVLFAFPRWAREGFAPLRRTLDAVGLAPGYTEALDGLAAAPTVAAGLRELGLQRCSEWLWRSASISTGPSRTTHPLCRPIFFIPGLEARPFYREPLKTFPGLQELEEQCSVVQAELEAAVASGALKSYVIPPNGQSSSLQKVEGWRTLPFISVHGKVQADVVQQCPRTWKLLNQVPGFIPETLCMFSSVNPGGRIRSHAGLTNGAVRVHLGLKVPEPGKTVLRVGDEVSTWEEGKCICFNDAFDHEVWNFGSKTRIVLFFDVWHPDLTPADIRAMEPSWRVLRTYGEVAARYERESKEVHASEPAPEAWMDAPSPSDRKQR